MFKRLSSALLGNYAVCVSCGRKMPHSCFDIIDGNSGLCSECFNTLKFTKYGSSFAADEPLSYLLCPLEYTGAIEIMLHEFKFHSAFKNGDIINTVMKGFLEYYPMLKDFDCVIPVPLSDERSNDRGYNQSEIIARSIAEFLSLPLDTHALKRIRHTERQSALTAAQRVENVRGAFRAGNRHCGERTILVDDIYTTGNTLRFCAEELVKSGVDEVIGITAARRMFRERPLLYN